MITINDRFSFDADEYNWILYDTHKFKAKDGTIKQATKILYPSTLEYLCEIVMNDTPKKSGDARSILNAILQSKNDLLPVLKTLPDMLGQLRVEKEKKIRAKKGAI